MKDMSGDARVQMTNREMPHVEDVRCGKYKHLTPSEIDIHSDHLLGGCTVSTLRFGNRPVNRAERCGTQANGFVYGW